MSKSHDDDGDEHEHEHERDEHYEHDKAAKSDKEVDKMLIKLNHKRKNNNYSFMIDVTLPNTCSICTEVFDLEEFNKVSYKLQFICSHGDKHNSHANYDPDQKYDDIRGFLNCITSLLKETPNICSQCFEKMILEHSKHASSYYYNPQNQEVLFNCPLNHYHHLGYGLFKTEKIRRILPNQLSDTILKRLEKEFILRTYRTAYCPVPDCEYFQASEAISNLIGNNNKPILIQCPNHGNRCSICWDSIESFSDHKCKNLPPEIMFEKWGTKESIGRCPHCNSLIIKNNGCNNMICRCGYEFDWRNAKIAFNDPNPSVSNAGPVHEDININIQNVDQSRMLGIPQIIETLTLGILIGSICVFIMDDIF